VAFNAAFAEAGLDWDWSEELYGKLLTVTGGKERIRYYLDHYNTAFQPPDDLHGFVAALHRSKTDHYTRMLAEGAIPLRSGVRRLLSEARAAGLRLAIATTTTPANVSALLRHSLATDGDAWFEVIAAGDVVPAKKPAPDIYVWAMERMGLKPTECMAFEDSENGVLSARDAGIRSIIVTTNGYTQDHDFPGATLVLDQFGEPGRPCRVLEGDLEVQGMLEISHLRRLHADCETATEGAGR